MSALNLALLEWGFLAIFFLITTFFIKKNLIIVILLNLIFNIVGYITVADSFGVPKPMDYSIPLYQHKEWNKSGVHLFGYYSDLNNIYLMVDEGVPRFYSIPYDDDFISELKRAITKANGDIRDVKIIPADPDAFYGNANTSTHFRAELYDVKPFDSKAPPPPVGDTEEYKAH